MKNPVTENSPPRKPPAVIGTSPGAIGTAVAQQQLRSVLSFRNSPQMNSPEAYIQFEPGLITEDAEVTNKDTAEFLRKHMLELHAFMARVLTVHPRIEYWMPAAPMLYPWPTDVQLA